MLTFEHMIVTMDVSLEPYREGVVMPQQSHGSVVAEILTGTESLTACDGVVTGNPALTIGVHTADCAPICMTDGTKVVVVHAGWRGLCGGIIEHGLLKLGRPLEIFVGPHLHTFEIERDFCYDAITEKFGDTFLEANGERYLFRFKDAIASLLPECTAFDPRNTETVAALPSYRHKRMFGHIITSAQLTSFV